MLFIISIVRYCTIVVRKTILNLRMYLVLWSLVQLFH